MFIYMHVHTKAVIYAQTILQCKNGSNKQGIDALHCRQPEHDTCETYATTL